MALVDKSNRPYYDDYDKNKDYYNILFRPSFAVQTRELNQIQSMFESQISRIGDHVFEEGSVVIPGETNFDLDLDYVTISIFNYESIRPQIVPNLIYIESASGLRANVKVVAQPDGSDPLTFYLEYLKSGNNQERKFQNGDVVSVYNDAGDEITTTSITGRGIASKFTINNGVYYLNGRFVLIEQETVLLDKYSNTPSKIVCIEYNETIVTENNDPSLLDNAQGTPNYTAPGAHRLRVDTNLKVFDLADLETLPNNVYEIFRIENGEVQRRYSGPEYNILNDVLAQRTYEESGNYAVKSFKVGFKEYGTVFPQNPDDSKFVIGVEPGLAYVKGYRVETLSTQNVVVDKARDTDTINNSSISASLGYYIVVESPNILPNVSTLQTVTFYDSAVSSPGVQPSGNALGTARVRFLRRDGTNYRLYLFDVRDASGARSTGFISDSLSVFSSEGQAFSADLVDSELVNPSENQLVFPLNVQYVRSLYDNMGVSDTSYSSVKQITTTTDSNGVVTLTASSNEVFVNQDPTFSFASFNDTGELVETSDKFSLGGVPSGSVITFDFGSANSGRPVRINAQVAKQQVQQKTKTIQAGTKTGSLDGDGRLFLDKADAFKITSVVDDGDNDVTDSFVLTENKTKSFYDVSYVTGPQSGITYPVTVEFNYFSHSSGDYFGPDSYVDFEYDEIPEEDGNRLSDVLDFRPRISDDRTGFSGSGSSFGNIPTPFSIIRADVDHYLPRIDKLYVDTNGEFGVVSGVPALRPKQPEDPSDAMVLYVIGVDAYTFSLTDIQAQKVNNRRYTMRDIGRLENRLSNVEYYVSLNNLEQEADSKQVVDPQTGLNRFKNGFMTDAFINHSVGDFAWDRYHVSMSPSDSEMRPEFSLNAVDLEYNEDESTNLVVNGNIVTLPFTETSFIKQTKRSNSINVNPYAIFRWAGDLTLNPSVDSWLDTVYTNPDVTYELFNNGRLTQTWNSWQLNWSGGSTTESTSTSRRSGLNSSLSPDGFWMQSITTTTTKTTTNTNIDIVNDRVVDTSVIPYMRSIDVELTGIGNRPESRIYFFFDDVNIDDYIRPDGGSFGQPVITDSQGEFSAVFRIPNSEERRFRTGEKQVVATDEPDNIREESTSRAEATFTAAGVRETRQRTIVATRKVDTSTTTRVRWVDPIAQSFLVERSGGAFVTKVNVFFETKDENVPVTVELREMENGSPTQRIVPGGRKILNPSQINLSDDGSVPTSFEFPYPVHLSEGSEYCFVVLSNSNNYNMFIATMGERDIGSGEFIVEQPYAGVMFKSQNNSTWTADQNSDVQFEIFAAQFNTNVVGNLILDNSDFDDITLPLNPIETEIGSNTITVYRNGHNYVVGSEVTISGAIGGNGIPDGELNATHIVDEVISPEAFNIVVSSNATISGFIGGDTVNVSNTVQASIMNPNITDLQFPGTGITYRARGTSGKSINGTETPYQVFNNYINVSNKEINELSVPWLITNRSDEAENINGSRSLKMSASFASSNPNISPVIDLEGASVITPFYLITEPGTNTYDGSDNWANYRSKVTTVRQPANSLRVFLDAQLPSEADIIVSFRKGNSDEEIQESEWQVVPDVNVQTTGDSEEFLENEFGIDNVDEFTQYQIMIQLRSVSATRVPICKRLRVLALGT